MGKGHCVGADKLRCGTRSRNPVRLQGDLNALEPLFTLPLVPAQGSNKGLAIIQHFRAPQVSASYIIGLPFPRIQGEAHQQTLPRWASGNAEGQRTGNIWDNRRACLEDRRRHVNDLIQLLVTRTHLPKLESTEHSSSFFLEFCVPAGVQSLFRRRPRADDSRPGTAGRYPRSSNMASVPFPSRSSAPSVPNGSLCDGVGHRSTRGVSPSSENKLRLGWRGVVSQAIVPFANSFTKSPHSVNEVSGGVAGAVAEIGGVDAMGGVEVEECRDASRVRRRARAASPGITDEN